MIVYKIKLLQFVVHYLFPAQVIYIHVSSWLVEGKWLATKKKILAWSPLHLKVLYLIDYQLENNHFWPKKN